VEVESQFDSRKQTKEEGRRKEGDERGVRTENIRSDNTMFYKRDSRFPMTMVIGDEKLAVPRF